MKTKVFNDQLDRKLAEVKKQAANYEALASAELGHIKAEQMFKKEITKNSKKHGTQLTQNAIVNVAGAPINVMESGGARHLTYFNQYLIAGVGYYLDSNGNKITDGTTVTCELNIELRQGDSKVDFRVVDYQLFATNSGCRGLS